MNSTEMGFLVRTFGSCSISITKMGVLFVTLVLLSWYHSYISFESLSTRFQVEVEVGNISGISLPNGTVNIGTEKKISGVSKVQLVTERLNSLDNLLTTRKNITISNSLGHHQQNISEILDYIKRINSNQAVLNKEKYGPVTNDTIVIVIQVHTRIIYLREVIKSLSQVRSISTVLLVLSHDFYDPEINGLVQAIRFCKVMQIFYPNSIQTHPYSFPGPSTQLNITNGTLFRRLVDQDSAKKRGDCQIKHHWWWKINFVFDHIEILKQHEGLFMFLEEDHYVSPDILQVVLLMNKAREEKCPQCEMLAAGDHKEIWGYDQNSFKATVIAWQHNMGMVFNRTFWNKLRNVSKTFCTFDDYNWDWTLQFISQNLFPPAFSTMVIAETRVFHIGKCGVHIKNSDCNPSKYTANLEKMFNRSSKHMFPGTINLKFGSQYINRFTKGWGSWNDPRDHQLCLSFVSDKKTD